MSADLTEQEGKLLVETFNQSTLKPKFDTKEYLEAWLKSYRTESDKSVKTEPGVTSGTGPGATSITTVATNQQPKISLVNGDKVKGEATYDQWVYEVKCLLIEKAHKPEVIAQAIRRSLRGGASNLVRRLGIGASIPDI